MSETTGSGAVEDLTLRYKWVISDYSSHFDKTEPLMSPKFSFKYSDHLPEWQLKLYPRGAKEVFADDHLSLFLHITRGSDVRVDVAFYIVNDANDNVFVSDLENHKFGPDDPLANHAGWTFFLPRSDLLNGEKRLLTGDSLTILCAISFSNEFVLTADNYHSLLRRRRFLTASEALADFAKLLDANKFSDARFVSDGKKFHVHKAVLASRSRVFAEMFDGHNGNLFFLEATPAPVAEQLFRFVYTGEVAENIDGLAAGLYVAARKYALDTLAILCEDAMVESLTLDNVLEHLALADQHDADRLKAEALEFVRTHPTEVAEHPRLEQFGLRHSKLMCQVFRAVTCKKRRVDVAEIESVLPTE